MIRRSFITAAILLSGAAWAAPAQAPAAAPITSIHMVDSMAGWAQTADRLLRTVDGGAHWIDVLPPGAGRSGHLTAAFLGGSAAWIVPEPASGSTALEVFRTKDAGRTWARSRVTAASIGEMTFVDARTGWMAVDLDNAAGSEALRLLRTADGGATWVEVARTDRPDGPAGHGLPLGGDKAGFAFLDARTGWLAGYIPQDDYSYLYVTRNAGGMWERQALAIPAGAGTVQFGLAVPSVFAPGNAVLPVQLNSAGPALSLVYVTHDGGRQWIATAPLPCSMTAASFSSVRVGWLTDGARLYATIDAGHHWAALPRSALFTDVTELDFISASVGWAVRAGAPSLLKTADGGRTWTAVR
ncbi:MAG: WD40/YVTN/BNR-like repeat-containing protein [bacterium]